MDSQKNKDMFSVISDMESDAINFERVSRMLQLFDEHMEDELDILDPKNSGRDEYFLARFKILRAQLEATQILMHSALDEMRVHVRDGYDIALAQREKKEIPA